MRKNGKHSEEAKMKISLSQKGKRRGPREGSFAWHLSRIPPELILKVVSESLSIREACSKLDIHLHGSAYPAFRNFLSSQGIEIKHFLGQKTNSGERHRGNHKTDPMKRLILHSDTKKRSTSGLKDLLIKIGIDYKCLECGQDPTWNGKPLRLEVDHVNGQRHDDRPENLRFLCPHCHSQTPTFRGRNIKKNRPAEVH